MSVTDRSVQEMVHLNHPSMLSTKLKTNPESLNKSEVAEILNDKALRDQLDADSIIIIIRRYYYSDVLEQMLQFQDLRNKLKASMLAIALVSEAHAQTLISHTDFCTSLTLQQAVAIICRDSYSFNLLDEMLKKSQELHNQLKADSASIFEIAQVSVHHARILIDTDFYTSLTLQQVVAIIHRHKYASDLLEYVVTSSELCEKLRMDPVNTIAIAQISAKHAQILADYGLENEISVKLSSDQLVTLAKKSSPIAKKIIADNNLFKKLSDKQIAEISEKEESFHLILPDDTIKLEAWIRGAKQLIREQENDTLRVNKTRNFLRVLNMIYQEQLTNPETSYKDVPKIKAKAQTHMIKLITESGLKEDQQKQLGNDVMENTDSAIHYRHILPNSLAKIWSSKTAKQFSQALINIGEPVSEKTGTDIELYNTSPT